MQGPTQNTLGEDDKLVPRIVELYSCWSTDDEPLTQGQLLDELLLDIDGQMSGGISVMIKDDASDIGDLCILDNLTKNSGHGEHWGKIFAYLDDVDGNYIDTLKFDSFLLQPADAVITIESS